MTVKNSHTMNLPYKVKTIPGIEVFEFVPADVNTKVIWYAPSWTWDFKTKKAKISHFLPAPCIITKLPKVGSNRISLRPIMRDGSYGALKAVAEKYVRRIVI